MERCKYIILKHGHTPILFAPTLTHSEVADNFGGKGQVTGAGFVQFNYSLETGEVEAYCYGKSDSLGIGANKDDSWLVTQLTTRGW